jgi:extracellular factor (EF) 3-hydroxypalmitic acid methyl ester biosynthesis protein
MSNLLRIEAPRPSAGPYPVPGSARILAFPGRDRASAPPLDRIVSLLGAPATAEAALSALGRLLEQPDQASLAALRAHPLQALLLQEPLTALARGLPSAEAEWLDLLLGLGAAPARWQPTGPVGARLHAALRASGLALAAAERRAAIARAVDATAARRPRAAVLALGAGHLREAELTTRARSLEIWLAVEEDSEARAEIARAHDRHRRIATTADPLNGFLAKPLRHGRFDLIHIGGLCDQAPAAALGRLARAAFAALRPGGRLLLANHAAGLAEAPYVTQAMGRPLFCRDAATLGAILEALPASQRDAITVRQSPSGGMLFAEVSRRG